MYDYYLGGFHNFPADRKMAQEAIRMWPELPMMMRANRAFLRRAVRFAVAQGVTQFLDIGSGIPTVGNSHEIARQADSKSRVVYVDVDPVAVTHSRAILVGDVQTIVVHADLRDPDRIVDDESIRQLIDFDRPVAVLLVAVLHFMPDEDDPRAVISRLRETVAPGSLLVISHASQDGQPALADSHQKLVRAHADADDDAFAGRDSDTVRRFRPRRARLWCRSRSGVRTRMQSRPRTRNEWSDSRAWG